MSEDRASCYARKQRMTTAETWDARRKVGPDVAAEIRKTLCLGLGFEMPDKAEGNGQ